MDDVSPEQAGRQSPGSTRTHQAAIPGGASVGPYRLLERLGEGGMGEVWLAEQVRPVRRQVAVKIIKAGLDTAQVVARFEAERQALALMDHPAIAKVFDAGSTPEGRPYFAMEHVRGESLTTYCDRQHLSLGERLELFVQICEGVQHAHQKGIIHRDLKPSNILLTLQDDRPVPKIIDFGVAKAASQPLTEHTLYTSAGGFVGTPEYMSPEQADGGGNVDTRTDVYALGVVLYELLTGVLPFDRQVFAAKGLDEIRRTIREVDPPRPSTRVTQLGSASLNPTAAHRTEHSRLASNLRGDLDWITMKALEKDRTRRYGSASDLAADIRRHLTNQPVLAGPPTALYRSQKFVLRHRFGVVAAGAVLLVLVAFAATMAVQARRIARERDRANSEAARANLEAAAARQVSEFLVNLFKVSDPSEARGASLTAREILDKGSRDVDKTLAGQPEVQARLQGTIGSVYTGLGLYNQARVQLERAAATQEKVLGKGHVETLTTLHRLADAYWHQGRLDDAEGLYRRVSDHRTALLGGEHVDTLRARFDLASVYIMKKQWTDAEGLAVETLATQRRVLGPTHADTLSSMNNLQTMYYSQRRYADAERIAREVFHARGSTMGADHPSTLMSAHNLASILNALDRDDEAITLSRDTIERKQRVLGESHPETAFTRGLLSTIYRKQGRFSESEALALVAYDTLRKTLGEDHVRTVATVNMLVKLYDAWKKPAKAAQWRARVPST